MALFPICFIVFSYFLIICVFFFLFSVFSACSFFLRSHVVKWKKTVHIIMFSDNKTFVLHVMRARLQLPSFTCCATRLTLPQKQYHIHQQNLTKHFILGHTIHHIIFSIYLLHFLWYHLNPKSDINKWKLICLPQNTL